MIKDPKNVIIIALVALVFFLILISSGTLSMAKFSRTAGKVPMLDKRPVPANVEVKTETPVVPTPAATTAPAVK